MSLTASEMTALGTPAPDFELPATNPDVDEAGGETRALSDYGEAEALVVVFTCNHCPYAKHVERALIQVARDYKARGVQFVAISSNDAAQYPDDAPDAMAERAEAKDYPFPYLYDETQEVAKAYGAVCTPDVFVYGPNRRLAYRGRIDETRPNGGKATAADLRQALDELLEGGKVQMEQVPSMGCNIKWKREG